MFRMHVRLVKSLHKSMHQIGNKPVCGCYKASTKLCNLICEEVVAMKSPRKCG